MRVTFVPERIKPTSWQKYLTRFVFGGGITAFTGLLASQYGPSVGGLFLAFPAILPAAVTLIEEDEGKEPANADARGAAIGSVGLMAFGAVVWLLAAQTKPWLSLADATVAWFAISAGLWIVFQLMTSVFSKENLSPTTSSTKSDLRQES